MGVFPEEGAQGVEEWQEDVRVVGCGRVDERRKEVWDQEAMGYSL